MDEAINKGDFLNITEGGVPHQYMCINQLFAREEKITKEKVRLFLKLQKEQRGALTHCPSKKKRPNRRPHILHEISLLWGPQ